MQANGDYTITNNRELGKVYKVCRIQLTISRDQLEISTQILKARILLCFGSLTRYLNFQARNFESTFIREVHRSDGGVKISQNLNFRHNSNFKCCSTTTDY